MKKHSQFEIWIADLNPRFGTEPGKRRPVCIIQTDLLNNIHPSTIICPITTNINVEATLLRIHLKKGECGMKADCDIMVDQLRAIDNSRLVKKTGELSVSHIERLKNAISVIIDF